MTTTIEVRTPTIRERLLGLMDILLDNSGFGSFERNVIRGLAKNYLSNSVTDEQLREQIYRIRDEVIPLILGEDPKQ